LVTLSIRQLQARFLLPLLPASFLYNPPFCLYLAQHHFPLKRHSSRRCPHFTQTPGPAHLTAALDPALTAFTIALHPALAPTIVSALHPDLTSALPSLHHTETHRDPWTLLQRIAIIMSVQVRLFPVRSTYPYNRNNDDVNAWLHPYCLNFFHFFIPVTHE
jgi:hypothetical protein